MALPSGRSASLWRTGGEKAMRPAPERRWFGARAPPRLREAALGGTHRRDRPLAQCAPCDPPRRSFRRGRHQNGIDRPPSRSSLELLRSRWAGASSKQCAILSLGRRETATLAMMPAIAPPPEVVVDDLHKAFDGKPVLQGVSLTIGRGDTVAIVGGSGCGKTVLLKHLTAHFKPDAGRVLVANHDVEPDHDGIAPLCDVNSLDDDALDQIRLHWAVVFQRNALLTGSVFHNLAVLPREVKHMHDEQIMPLARRALVAVGLDPDLVLQRDREQLSGGMAKRVAIARALVMDPVLVLYDEPTAGLDPEMCVQIHDLIKATHATQPQLAATRRGIVRTSVVVTHDTELLRRLEPRVVMLHAGGVLFDGPFREFIASDDPHIQPYLHQMSSLHARVV